MTHPSVKHLLQQWIVFSSEFEHRLERYWFNALLTLIPIALWWAIASLVVTFGYPFGFLVWLGSNDTLLGMAALAWVTVVILFLVAKPPPARLRSVGLFVAWVVLTWGVWEAWHPSPSSTDSRDFAQWCLQVWRGHPGWLAGWFTISGWHTVLFVIRNQRSKLQYYWMAVIGGFTGLSALYVISPPLGLLIALSSPHEFFNRYLKSPSEKDVTLRGSVLTEPKKAQYEYNKRLDLESRLSRQTIPFGEVNIPVRELTTHLVAVGSAGSGKSITLKLIMQACLPMVSPVNGMRAVVFDRKHNAYSELMGLDGISAEIVMLNPFHRDAAWYDLAKDFTSYSHAQALADILIPEPKASEKSDKFFRDAAINIVTGIILLWMNNAPGQWRLSDIVRAFSSEKLLRCLLASHDASAYYLNTLGSEKTASNIMASVAAEITRYLPIAALWEHAGRGVSLKEWLQGGQIWLLGADEEAMPPLNAINRLILTRMSQALLKEGDHPEPRTFMLLDELQSLHVETLQDIATMGRSKGISLIAAFQSIQGMYHRYGKEITDSIFGQFRHKAFLKMSDAATAYWASEQLGDSELQRTQASLQHKSGAAGTFSWSERTGSNQSIQQTRLVMPSEFMSIKAVHPPSGLGLTGYYQASSVNYKNYTPWAKLQAQLQPASEFVRDDDYAPEEHQYPAPWSTDDWERLGITAVMQRCVLSQDNPGPNNNDSDEGRTYA